MKNLTISALLILAACQPGAQNAAKSSQVVHWCIDREKYELRCMELMTTNGQEMTNCTTDSEEKNAEVVEALRGEIAQFGTFDPGDGYPMNRYNVGNPNQVVESSIWAEQFIELNPPQSSLQPNMKNYIQILSLDPERAFFDRSCLED